MWRYTERTQGKLTQKGKIRSFERKRWEAFTHKCIAKGTQSTGVWSRTHRPRFEQKREDSHSICSKTINGFAHAITFSFLFPPVLLCYAQTNLGASFQRVTVFLRLHPPLSTNTCRDTYPLTGRTINPRRGNHTTPTQISFTQRRFPPHTHTHKDQKTVSTHIQISIVLEWRNVRRERW